MALSFHERTKHLQKGILGCTKCGEFKKITEFLKLSSNATGYSPRCKTCTEEDRAATRAADPDRKLRHHLSSTYGITLEQLRQAEVEQKGRCKICGKAPEKGQHRLGVKLHEETQEFLGLLCLNCNHGLGKFGDDPERLRRAADFLDGR